MMLMWCLLGLDFLFIFTSLPPLFIFLSLLGLFLAYLPIFHVLIAFLLAIWVAFLHLAGVREEEHCIYVCICIECVPISCPKHGRLHLIFYQFCPCHVFFLPVFLFF